MRQSYSIILAISISMIGTWVFFVQIYKPTEKDFLETVAANYFRHMTEIGLSEIASYEDCRLDPSDAESKRQGVAMFGLCRAENETTKFYYMIAMSTTASILYFDMEEISK